MIKRRSDFDMRFNEGASSGNMLVGDKVVIFADISAVREASKRREMIRPARRFALAQRPLQGARRRSVGPGDLERQALQVSSCPARRFGVGPLDHGHAAAEQQAVSVGIPDRETSIPTVPTPR